MIGRSLFESESLRLTLFDPEKDLEVESSFTYQLDYAYLLRRKPLRPMGPGELRKIHEELQKQMEEKDNRFNYAVRQRSDDQLVGIMLIPRLHWMGGVAELAVRMGTPSLQEQYLPEALRMALTYCFSELGLFRLRILVPEYDLALTGACEQAGLQHEVCRRQALYRRGRYWDEQYYGILQSEWLPVED